MARRNDHSREELQEMAIQAAIAILSREGMQGLSTRKVAGAIGYTVGTLYLVFKNFDELILRVNAAALDELRKCMATELAEHQRPQAQLHAMALEYLVFARENYARWSLLFTHRLPEGVVLPGWFSEKVNILFRLAAMPLQQLNPSLTEAQYRQATHALWSSVHGVCELGLNNKLVFDGEIDPDELMIALVENFLRGFTQGWG